MPRARPVLNAFTASEVTKITGLSRPMIDYLRQQGFLHPAYGDGSWRRGRVRYYSYRDLVIARLIQRLRATGVELRRLKKAVVALNAHPHWVAKPENAANKIRWLLSDGKKMYIQDQDGFLDEMSQGQRAFAFVVNLDQLEDEVRRKVPAKQRRHCTIDNDPEPRFETERQPVGL